MTFRIVDRRQSYFARAALNRAMDADEFHRRYQKGLDVLATMYRPRIVEPIANVLILPVAPLRIRANS